MDLFGLPPELLAALGPLLPVVLVCLYLLKKLTNSDSVQKECSDGQKKLETRVAVLEAKMDSTSVVLSEIKSELATIQSDVKLLLSRKE